MIQFNYNSLILLIVLVILEAVLSADNAVALASIATGLKAKENQQKALNIGLVIAYVLRIGLIFCATFVMHNVWFQVAGALYLFWLTFNFFTSKEDEDGNKVGPQYNKVSDAVLTLAFTDLAFSLDSVATAVSISTDTAIVITGATMGVIILKFMAQQFIVWLEEYPYLETAGYITVGLAGVKLLAHVVFPEYEVPEWMILTIVGIIFGGGFSKKSIHINTNNQV
jgi:YkoY family integral membrane protein